MSSVMARGGTKWWRSRWWLPLYSLALGGVVLSAAWIGGNLDDGLRAFACFVIFAAVFAFGSRSETISGLGGPGRDERWAMIDMKAGALAGWAVGALLIGSWIVELARGRDGSPYGQVIVVGALAYVLAIVVLRRRS